jgi:hypothetical protein
MQNWKKTKDKKEKQDIKNHCKSKGKESLEPSQLRVVDLPKLRWLQVVCYFLDNNIENVCWLQQNLRVYQTRRDSKRWVIQQEKFSTQGSLGFNIKLSGNIIPLSLSYFSNLQDKRSCLVYDSTVVVVKHTVYNQDEKSAKEMFLY